MEKKSILNKRISLARLCGALSVFTLVFYHWKFFSYLIENIEPGFNGVVIVVSVMALLLAGNYLFYYLLCYCGRIVGKCLLALLFIGNAISVYFINTYQVLINDSMMGNVFNTQYSEASSFFSWKAVIYLLIFGVAPCAEIFIRRVDYGSVRRFLANIGAALGALVVIALANMPNWTWVDRHIPTLGSLALPWSYTVNTIRYHNAESERNRKEIPLPDAKIATGSRDVCVLIIGESARLANFSLYGYGRKTNPLMEKDSVVALRADAATTYTTGSVKAILDHKPTDDLYEILPNYLFRNGVDVEWRTSNWGEPPVHIDDYYNLSEMQGRFPDNPDQHDGVLLAGLKERIAAGKKDKLLIVVHTYTSHGPSYSTNYPAEFEVFKPVCNTVEMSKADPKELINAYDNTILYTDHLVHSVIDVLRQFPDRRGCVMFVSDHGESLGEGNMYMHGVPMAMAPKEQTEVPFIVWTSDARERQTLSGKSSTPVSHYHVFHSVLSFLGMESPIYNAETDIFAK